METLNMSDNFEKMTTEELRAYMDEHQGEEAEELAFLEYKSRLNWKKVKASVSPQEEEQIIQNLIQERIKS